MANSLAVIFVGVCIVATSVTVTAKLNPARDEAIKRIDVIFNNTRMRESYIRCFMGRGLCFKEAMELKNMIPDALLNNCSKCTEVQRLTIDRFFKYLLHSRPKLFNKLVARFDPNGEFKKYVSQKENDDNDAIKTTTLKDSMISQTNSTQEDTTMIP